MSAPSTIPLYPSQRPEAPRRQSSREFEVRMPPVSSAHNATPLVERQLAGWGNFPSERCWVARPEGVDALQRYLHEPNTQDVETFIPRGLGRAYGDAALNESQGVLTQTRRNHFLEFDPQRGLLRAEAGVSFAEIITHLLPRGWFLPTTPGTKFVTLGGAIAADVHGKNHHRVGSFGNFVQQLELLTANGEVVTCSAEENSPLFWATVGGMGLTGIILSAQFQLTRVESAYCLVDTHRTRNLTDTLDYFEATDSDHQHSVAWIDCLARGDRLGRSVVMQGNDARLDDLPRPYRNRPLELKPQGRLSVPFYAPSFALNRFSVQLLSAVYYAKHRDSHRVVDFDSFFYPLDGVHGWNRVYGRRGFVQYQALFPPDSARAGLTELLRKITEARCASFLAVLKRSGAASPGMLSYLYPGYTLALDFPHTGEKLRRLLRELDAVVLDHGGRLYLAKDATTTPEAFAEMYPRLDEFRAVKAQVDPENRFCSSQARRLHIV